ncbi:lysozyme inhibitor LprI family protein [Noviherbaspirillum aridicola]|uniref:Lysozyme inhibitor LprI-like N-terminal domain-containing protein n=1 Tax=Noviherbaspirillum aridicola TaxID=2849687 RepID=A0ABQ4Q1T3_9BURK|nr:lysozyme inhibitor LprI family protein [Noviherbaspirillum aridicola]GIZ51120.1 hypothetical protein NCCP691_11340 [Noviherbaspirillum aridicola]
MQQPVAAIAGALLIALAFPGTSLAASYDCKKASTLTEIVICADQRLSVYDEQLSAVYNRIKKANPLAESELVNSQRKWLKSRNTCSSDVGCLSNAYASRLLELQQLDRSQ